MFYLCNNVLSPRRLGTLKSCPLSHFWEKLIYTRLDDEISITHRQFGIINKGFGINRNAYAAIP